VSRAVPIVFVTTIDPVGSGFVASLARPGGNATGFIAYEFSIGGKWLELLKEIAPRVTRAAVIRDPTVPAGSGGFAAIQTVATSFRVELTPVGVHDADEIERGIAAFAREPNGGLITSLASHRDLIITLAARHRMPAVYAVCFIVTAGGLISYGSDAIDRIGARPAMSIAHNGKGARPLGT
jgi:putative tryptophan/tyrosine transport system substrate-binding protein